MKLIAELGANHCKSLENSLAILNSVNCDIFKVQYFTVDSMVSRGNERVLSGPWGNMALSELYEQAALPYKIMAKLRMRARYSGIPFMVSVFHPRDIDDVEKIEPDYYKIASFEADYGELIDAVIATGRPFVISMGRLPSYNYSWLKEKIIGHDVQLAHCISKYPALYDEMALSQISSLRERFDLPVGLSCHAIGCIDTIAVMAVALGSVFMEVHVCNDKREGYDSKFSLMPNEFNSMAEMTRSARKALSGTFRPSRSLRRALVATKTIQPGEPIDDSNTDMLRVVADSQG